MSTINFAPNSTKLKALKYAVDVNIDILNDMAADPMWLTPADVRKLSTLSDEEIRTELSKNSKEIYENIDMLVALQLLQTELNEIQ